MSSAAPVELRCPDCGKAPGPLASRPACPGCGRSFGAEDGVWDLRPAALGAEQVAEDALHAEPGLSTWRRLFYHKRYWMESCDRRWLPELVGPRTRTVLEVGGGLCYASALAKARAPQATVVATDVSPRYLRQHAREAGTILGAPADVYAAVDAEHLPFEDGQFDAVYSQVVLYRLPHPARALREIRRVLAPGGRWLGIERASPWSRPFLRREARAMAARAGEQQIGERPLTYRQWQALLREADVAATIAPVPGARLRSAALRRLANGARPIHVELRLTR
jgi:ubiquinone/menaquinone biosynthesis C-methylase UbiE